MQGRRYDGPGHRVLGCSAKTALAVGHSRQDISTAVWKGVRAMINSLPATTREEVTGESVTAAVQAGMRDVQPAAGNSGAGDQRTEPTMADVRALRKHFPDMVISLIDKGRGELAVL